MRRLKLSSDSIFSLAVVAYIAGSVLYVVILGGG